MEATANAERHNIQALLGKQVPAADSIKILSWIREDPAIPIIVLDPEACFFVFG
jgi:hypothetical protein